ncbi:MAG: heavy-metal-associated domain-containing protein [Magnetovibrio sp.]|nr:heavy-metal-associated domain-containing protein [Magnetovibrio sp.]
MSDTYSVLGMSCEGCAKSITKAILEISTEAKVKVDLDAKTITVDGIDAKTMAQVVEDSGFEFGGPA